MMIVSRSHSIPPPSAATPASRTRQTCTRALRSLRATAAVPNTAPHPNRVSNSTAGAATAAHATLPTMASAMVPRVRVEQECDFDGRAIANPEAVNDLSPLAACLDSGGSQHSLVYTGLEGAGPHLAFLTANVHFSVSSGHRSETVAGPMEVGADGRVYAAVQYPSLRDLWPEVYHSRAVRVVQVDVHVEVRSGPQSIQYPGTEFKVTYRRRRTPADDVVLWRPQDVLHTIRR